MASNDRIPRKTENLLEREIEDEIVVMSPDGKILHTFKDSALFIWKRIDGLRSMDRILEELTEEFQVEIAVARSDLETFMSELHKLNLLILE